MIFVELVGHPRDRISTKVGSQSRTNRKSFSGVFWSSFMLSGIISKALKVQVGAQMQWHLWAPNVGTRSSECMPDLKEVLLLDSLPITGAM